MPKLSIACENAVYHRLRHRQKSKCLLRLNHDGHAIIEKHITIPSQHLPS